MKNISAEEFYNFMKQALEFFDLRWKDKDKMEIIIGDGTVGFRFANNSVYILLARGGE